MQVQARTHQVFMGLRHSHVHRDRACTAFPMPEPGRSPCFATTPANQPIFDLATDPGSPTKPPEPICSTSSRSNTTAPACASIPSTAMSPHSKPELWRRRTSPPQRNHPLSTNRVELHDQRLPRDRQVSQPLLGNREFLAQRVQLTTSDSLFQIQTPKQRRHTRLAIIRRRHGARRHSKPQPNVGRDATRSQRMNANAPSDNSCSPCAHCPPLVDFRSGGSLPDRPPLLQLPSVCLVRTAQGACA